MPITLLWTINAITKWKRWENIEITLGVDYFQERDFKMTSIEDQKNIWMTNEHLGEKK